MSKNKIASKTRRANNEGSICQRKDGRWVGVATVGYDNNGKIIRKSVYGKSRMEVAQKLGKLTNRISTNNFDYINNSTIATLMQEWLMVFKKSYVTPRTFEGNMTNFKLHIKPQIGNMKLDEVTNVTIQKLLNDMLSQGYSLATTKKVKFILNQFFEYAVEINFATSNPTVKTRVRSAERKIYDGEHKYKAMLPEIRDKFIKCLNENSFLKPLCLTMMFGGLRTGEVLALTWDNIDFENKEIKVEKAITQIPKFDSDGKIIERITVISDTKTVCSVRTVPMPDILIEALKEYKNRQINIGVQNNINFIKPNDIVFCNDDGSLRTYSGTRKIFDRFKKRHGLDKCGIHFHGLRHTYSNMLFEANQNPKVIQGLLGHKSVNTTITTYNSVDKSSYKNAMSVFNDNFKQEEVEKSILSVDDEIEELERLLERKKKQREFEM